MTKPISEMSTAEILAEYNALTGKSVKKFSSRAAGEKQLAAARLAAEKAGEAQFTEPSEEAPETAPKSSFAVSRVPQAETTEPNVEQMAAEAAAAETNEDGQEATEPSAEVAEPTETEQPAETTNEGGQEAKPKRTRKAKEPKEAPAPIEPKCPKCGQTEDQTPAGLPNTVAGEKRRTCQYCVIEYWVATGEVFDAQSKKEQRAEAIANSWKDPEVKAARSERTGVNVEGYGSYRSVPAAFKELGLPMSRMITFRLEVKKNGHAIFRKDGVAYAFSVVS